MGEFSAVILNGGKSSRISVKNKGLLEIGGMTILERILAVLDPLFEDILVISNSPGEIDYFKGRCRIFKDEVKGLGPIGGIYTGLKKMKNQAGFFVACDMPFLNAELIRDLLKSSEGFDAVCPRCREMIEPLHAVYSKKCIGAIEALIKKKGSIRVRDLLAMVRTRYIDVDTEKIHLVFFNINTREDYERALLLEKDFLNMEK
ncbi:molybdenum cofactor guanylyltransferase [Thermosediminibacter oceani]|uniref:Probable molybdenum cofactor guanylyltransferase n=1 Tax=Thermosediminibacter oceani (strain ATCC BAA-1034 / DSM 16646 / JW/IW-1228P) TaxID=555079 RepID=D9RZT2_THEOJ|nr:molybdenum cofactor guanylyltransferase [Thermosediminibacter oceani]ADL08709.1 molybdenum cofactor guanylyltransferase [Thermosediminibacter oceani DSM 16646]